MSARRNTGGFTLFEIIIVLLLACIVFGLLGTFIWRNARVSRATDRKLQAISAVHYLEGRVRRDLKGAKSFAVEDQGHKLTITDMEDRKRVYQYNPQDRTLVVPDLLDPSVTSNYELARFREVLFKPDSDGGGLTFVFSAVPFYDTGAKLSEEELGWGSAIAGRVTFVSRAEALWYPGANLQGL